MEEKARNKALLKQEIAFWQEVVRKHESGSNEFLARPYVLCAAYESAGACPDCPYYKHHRLTCMFAGQPYEKYHEYATTARKKLQCAKEMVKALKEIPQL
jgi:hypothetical protein